MEKKLIRAAVAAGLPALLAVCLVPWSAMAQTRGGGTPGGTPTPPPSGRPAASAAQLERVKSFLPKLSGGAQMRIAKRLGITEIMGKRLDMDKKVKESPRAGHWAPVGTDPDVHENEPSIAVNPADDRFVVVGMHEIPNDPCVTYRSEDGGVTFGDRVTLPLLFGGDSCSDPVIRYSPSGDVLYASYMSIAGDLSAADIVVSTSTDDGQSWSAVVVAINGAGTGGAGFPDKNWIGVHKFDTTQNGFVYVTSTRFDAAVPGDCQIVFSRSTDNGLTFPNAAAPTVLANSPSCAVLDPLVQGSSVEGAGTTTASNGDLLVCWYNSDLGGWLGGSFDIRCRASQDNGVSFLGEVTAANNVSFELPFWLCPASDFHRWWGGMFPHVAIAPNNSAHVVFARDPTAGAANSECGDVVYVRSAVLPWGVWTLPVTLGSDANARAQGYPTIVAQRLSAGSKLHVAWYDHRRSVGAGIIPNSLYDVFRRTSTNGGATWSAPVRVTSEASMSDDVFIGDYIDLSASMRRTHVAWTDRADKTDQLDPEDDVLSAHWE